MRASGVRDQGGLMKIFEKSASRRRFFRRGLMLGGGLLAVPASQAAPANETLKAIHIWRTIQGDFPDKPVPDESVRTILDASVRAANASNSQTYRSEERRVGKECRSRWS